MNCTLKEILINTIINNIPENMKAVDYLAGILKLGRDSIYRRLNGQIDFSVIEISILAQELNFSLDEIHCKYDSELALFGFQNETLASPEKSMMTMIQFHCDNMKRLRNATNGYVFTATNQLLGLVALDLKYQNLWKFIYYRWSHQLDTVPLNYYFKDLQIPKDILDLIETASCYKHKLKQITVFDENILYNIMRGIKYYKDSGLMTDEDIYGIKTDIKNLLDYLQALLQSGMDEAGALSEIYLSSVNISSNFTYVDCDGEESVLFYVHSDDCIYTRDKELCALQKQWLDSIKRYSVLLTQSNQKMQIDFVNRQYKYLQEL